MNKNLPRVRCYLVKILIFTSDFDEKIEGHRRIGGQHGLKTFKIGLTWG